MSECSSFDEHARASACHFSVVCGLWVCRPEVMSIICEHHQVEWNNGVGGGFGRSIATAAHVLLAFGECIQHRREWSRYENILRFHE